MARKKKGKELAKSRRSAAVPAEPVLEEVDEGGAGIEEGIVFTTFFMLAGAVYLLYSLLNGRYPVA